MALIDKTEKFVREEIHKYTRNPDISAEEMHEQEFAIWDKLNQKFGYTQEVDYSVGYDIDPYLHYYHHDGRDMIRGN